jgi:hypothetical protein
MVSKQTHNYNELESTRKPCALQKTHGNRGLNIKPEHQNLVREPRWQPSPCHRPNEKTPPQQPATSRASLRPSRSPTLCHHATKSVTERTETDVSSRYQTRTQNLDEETWDQSASRSRFLQRRRQFRSRMASSISLDRCWTCSCALPRTSRA